jgi:hypothetical protein
MAHCCGNADITNGRFVPTIVLTLLRSTSKGVLSEQDWSRP